MLTRRSFLKLSSGAVAGLLAGPLAGRVVPDRPENSCPVEPESDNLGIGIYIHDPYTGLRTNADVAPTYCIYEQETSIPVLTGTLVKSGAANELGFYSEPIMCSASNGFKDGKNYMVCISATVGGITGNISCGFRGSELKEMRGK